MEKNTEMAAPTASVATRPAKKTMTNWNGFVKAGLVPTRITCQGYPPTHRRDSACHSAVLLDASALERHVVAGHEGGFKIDIRRSEVPWKGWLELGDLGFEIHDLRCEWCNKEIPVHPQYLLKHLEAHSGAQKRLKPSKTFLLTISKDKPLPPIDDAE